MAKIISKGKVLNSSGFYEKKKRRRRVKVAGYLAVLALFLVGFIYLSRLEQLQITEVKIPGENIIDREEIIKITRKSLDGYYLWVIPCANVIFYPSRRIEQNLIEKFPRIKSINLELDGQKLLLVIEERTPFALYCPDTSDCFFIDEEGLIFAIAPSFSGGVYFTYTSESPIENSLGKRLVGAEEFKSLLKFMEDLVGLGIVSSALEIGESEYRLKSPNDREIIWRKNDDLRLIQSSLEAFLSSQSVKAQNNFLDRILYLDLRTKNKVFYKFK